MRAVYSTLLYLLTPVVILCLLWRGRKAPAYWQRWHERFAFYSSVSNIQNPVWIHAVSVGEAEAAFPLIKRLQGQYPQRSFLVTSTTPTGSSRIQAVLGESVTHVYFPYDLPGCIQRFLNHFKPSMVVIMETEIWPNLFHQCRLINMPLSIINARLSERSLKGYARLQSLTRETLSAVSWVAAQTQADAERFMALGVDEQRVTITGNLKFDLTLPDDLTAKASLIRCDYFKDRPVWIAASTHEGEDEQVLAALTQVQVAIPDILLTIAPRHPERFTKVADLCRNKGFSTVLRSQQRPCEANTDVFVIDTLGELKLFYGAADVAFVGGSLVPTGGHNVLEAAALGLPVLTGPHTFNFKEIIESLSEVNGLIAVADQQALASHVIKLMQQPDIRETVGQIGKDFVARNRGTLDKVCLHLADYL